MAFVQWLVAQESTDLSTQERYSYPPARLLAAVGTATFDAAGRLSARSTVSVGGKVSHRTANGTYTLNSDCTGTLTTSSYDESGNLVSTMTTDTVSVDYMSETRGIVTSFVLEPSGTSVPVTITLNARKLFPKRGHQHQE